MGPTPLRGAIPLVLGGVAALAVLLAPLDLAPAAQRTAAVAALMAVWWVTEALPIPVTALVPIVLFPLLGVLPVQEVTRAYGNHFVFLLLGGFFIAATVESTGLHRRIALHTLVAVGSSPPRLLLGFMLAAAGLSMWISNTATSVMLLPIAMAVSQRVEPGSDDHPFGRTLMLGLAYACSIGGIGTLVGTAPNAVLAGMVVDLVPDGPPLDFARWMLFGVPTVVILVPATWLYLRWVCAGQLGGSREVVAEATVEGASPEGGSVGDTLRAELRALGRPSPPERRAALLFGCAALLWITRRPIDAGWCRLPGWSELLPDPSGVSDAVVAIALGIAAFLVPSGRGRKLLTWEEALRVPWGVLLLFGGGFALAAAFASSGLAASIGGGLAGLAGLPMPLLVLSVALLLTFLTELTSNTAAVTTLLPILAAAAPVLGVPPLALMLPATVAASCAFMLPTATPPNAVVFGSGYLRIRQMARVGLGLNLLTAVLVTAAVLFIGLPVLGVR